MSWGNVFNAEEGEESFWPSFTDIMMVIVMTFLLVTVAVVMTNTRLLDELKSSLVAEQEANQLAQFTLKENSTLEEQLEYFQRRSASLEMELLRSRARDEDTRSELSRVQSELTRLQSNEQAQARTIERRDQELEVLRQDVRTQSLETNRLQTELKQAQQQLLAESSRLEAELLVVREQLATESSRLQTELQLTQRQLVSSQESVVESEQALALLREMTEDDRQKLASLKGDYVELDKKYQKLVKPTRSSKGKTVVDVMYRRSGYRIRKPGEADYRNVSLKALDTELTALKAKHESDLYVKIIIPENSGLSYNQAWAFTRDTLNKFDYYYQEDQSQPAE